MTSETIFESDKKQSISEADVKADQRSENPRGLVAGVVCAKEASHGRMLMSVKSGFLECAVCGYSVAAPQD